jgi:hypothetical protein
MKNEKRHDNLDEHVNDIDRQVKLMNLAIIVID